AHRPSSRDHLDREGQGRRRGRVHPHADDFDGAAFDPRAGLHRHHRPSWCGRPDAGNALRTLAHPARPVRPRADDQGVHCRLHPPHAPPGQRRRGRDLLVGDGGGGGRPADCAGRTGHV
ncbi:MAG: hypothetical protein AVDCRST_MAG31-1907, partial [uncultured Sphingomonas sp.]